MPAPIPAISSFTDGVVAHAVDLNSLGSNLTNLYNYTMGGFRTLKPACEVRLTNATFSVPNSTDTQISWDVADVNTDNMWSSPTPGQMTVQTAGTYFLYVQAVHTGAFSTFTTRLLVNGTTPSTNAVGSFSGNANGGNISAVVALAVNATIYGFVSQSTGAAVNLATTFGGCRMAAIWLSP